MDEKGSVLGFGQLLDLVAILMAYDCVNICEKGIRGSRKEKKKKKKEGIE
jgi:hypothetical protein